MATAGAKLNAVVIGAGLQGVTSAWFLAQAGFRVTVLEREAGVALGASHANSGLLTPSMADPWNAPGLPRKLIGWLGREDAPFLLRPRALPALLGWGFTFLANSSPGRFRASLGHNLRLASYSLEVLRRLRSDLDLAYDQRANGTLKIFRDAAAMDAMAGRCDQLAGLGLRLNRLKRDAAIAFEPALAQVRGGLAGAIHFPDDETGDARMFTEALAQKARAAGVTFQFGATVTGFVERGDRIDGVVTGDRRLEADLVVVAAGSWSPGLARMLGRSLAVQPVKGYSVTLPIGAWQPPKHAIVDDALHIAINPLGTRLRVAGTAELAGYDTAITPARIDNLFALLLAVFPSFAPHLDRGHAAPWAGFRPMSADGVPYIGRYAFDNLYLNTGQGHLGWTMAAGSAKLLADLVTGHPTGIDAGPYRPDR